jgi:hypothetical protein
VTELIHVCERVVHVIVAVSALPHIDLDQCKVLLVTGPPWHSWSEAVTPYPISAMPLTPFHWTLVQNIKRDPFVLRERGSAMEQCR